MKHLLLTALLIFTWASSVVAQEINDPIEPVNRAIFGFNEVVDTVVLDPAVIAYRAVIPKPARTGFKNFLNNLKSPIYLANNLLQGDLEGASVTVQRALINTMVGFGGIFDFAGYEGMNADREDFGQTLGVWGLGEGAYLVLPFLGPSNARDLGGMIVDGYADPINNYLDNIDEEEWMYARAAADGFTAKNEFYDVQQDLKRNSSDYYAAVRSAATQARRAAVKDNTRNGDGETYTALPEFNID